MLLLTAANCTLQVGIHTGHLDVPALGAVHHSAPEDPSTPLQKAQQPPPTQPLQSRGPGAQFTSKQQARRNTSARGAAQHGSDRWSTSGLGTRLGKAAVSSSATQPRTTSGFGAADRKAPGTSNQAAATLNADQTATNATAAGVGREEAEQTSPSNREEEDVGHETLVNRKAVGHETLVNRKAQAKLLPYLRNLMHARTDADVQASLRQDLPEGIHIPPHLQLLPRVSYMNDRLANMILQMTEDPPPEGAGTVASDNTEEDSDVEGYNDSEAYNDVVAHADSGMDTTAFLPSLDLLSQFGSSNSSIQSAPTTPCPDIVPASKQAGQPSSQSQPGAKPSEEEVRQSVSTADHLERSQRPALRTTQAKVSQPFTDPDIREARTTRSAGSTKPPRSGSAQQAETHDVMQDTTAQVAEQADDACCPPESMQVSNAGSMVHKIQWHSSAHMLPFCLVHVRQGFYKQHG